MDRAKVSWAVGLVAGVMAVTGGAKTFWHDVGWITPAQAEAKHVELADQQKILDAIESLQKQQVDSHEEWKCDEYDEELQALRRKLVRAEPGTDQYADLKHDIEKLETKMAAINCSRFEDFG